MKIRIEPLSENDETPLGVDLVSWPDCDSLLTYLEKTAGITVLSKKSNMSVDDYFAEFEYKTYRFEPSLWLQTLKGCPEVIYEELLEHVKEYSRFPLIRGLKTIVRYLSLPDYQGIYSKKE